MTLPGQIPLLRPPLKILFSNNYACVTDLQNIYERFIKKNIIFLQQIQNYVRYGLKVRFRRLIVLLKSK